MREHLVDERKAMSLTQKEMASVFEITERQYQALEAGTSRGSVKFWQKAKDYFNKPIDYLLEQASRTN